MLEYLWYFLCTEGVVMLNYSVYSKISIVSRLCAPKHVLQSRQMSIVVFHHEL
jgi:CRISPR/Cas system-associated protein endoribonuclease Cas2